MNTFTKDGLNYIEYKFPIIKQTNLFNQLNRQNHCNQENNQQQSIKQLNDKNQTKVLNKLLVINRASIDYYTEIENKIVSRDLANFKIEDNKFINQKAKKVKKVLVKDSKILNQQKMATSSIKLPAQLKQTVSCACQRTDPNNNLIKMNKQKKLNCLNHESMNLANSSDDQTFKQITNKINKINEIVKLDKIDEMTKSSKCLSIETTKSTCDLKFNDDDGNVGREALNDQNNNEILNKQFKSNEELLNVCKEEELIKGAELKSDEKLISKNLKVRSELKQKELNRKVIENCTKLGKIRKVTIMNSLMQSLPTQLLAIGLAAANDGGGESIRNNRLKNQIDLNNNLAPKSNAFSNKHHSNLANADCAVLINKKTKSSSLISPFNHHKRKDNKSQIKCYNYKIEKLNDQVCDKCLNDSNRLASNNCCLNCERKRLNIINQNKLTTSNSQKQTIQLSKQLVKKKKQFKMDDENKADSLLKETVGQLNQESAINLTTTAATNLNNEQLTSLSKQNSLDSPSKSNNNSNDTNSQSIESVWTNLREDYELGEVIGNFLFNLFLIKRDFFVVENSKKKTFLISI